MKKSSILLLLIIVTASLHAQKYYTKNGSISFFSKTSLENIAADNNQVLSTIDLQTGQLQFSVLIKSFHFKKSLMEEHFNESYMESDQFPKATFKGIIDKTGINLSKDGSYPVNVSGDMTIHGITKNITVPGTVSVKGAVVSANSNFKITVADYKISIPKIVKDNIAETIDVTVSCVYDKKM